MRGVMTAMPQTVSLETPLKYPARLMRLPIASDASFA
jgi:hypothetical protein